MTISNADEDAEKLDHSYSAGEKVKWHIIMENSLIVSYKTKYTTTIYVIQQLHSCAFTPEIWKCYVQRKICTWIFIAALFFF